MINWELLIERHLYILPNRISSFLRERIKSCYILTCWDLNMFHNYFLRYSVIFINYLNMFRNYLFKISQPMTLSFMNASVRFLWGEMRQFATTFLGDYCPLWSWILWILLRFVECGFSVASGSGYSGLQYLYTSKIM